MKMNRIGMVVALFVAQFFLALPTSGQTAPEKIEEAIKAVQSVGANGENNQAAVKALQVLNKVPATQIPLLLNGMDGASPIAMNWIRGAVNSVAANASELPVEDILKYFEDKKRSHYGRLVAFDLLDQAKKDWSKDVVPGLMEDPSLPLRFKAIEHWTKTAESAEQGKAIGYLATALSHARDVDQIQTIAKRLSERGVEIDLQKQFGFINQWHLVGYFDNKDEAGFNVAHGPEKDVANIDLAATYKGIDDKEAKWKEYKTVSSMGLFDLNKILGVVKGATVYAYADFDASEDRDAEIRIGCINAHKIWLNGELVMSNEVYHNGISPDKFSTPIKLKEGKNQILIKVCQNEQTQQWAQRWQFQVRICDKTGKPIKSDKIPSSF